MPEPTIFACPVCVARLEREPGRYSCANGHHYDRARQGHVNLLPRGRRRESGDSASMLQARRRVFEGGHYAPLAAAVAELSGDLDGRQVLDVGCGEGYYLRGLGAAAASCHGIDIARTAVGMAARAHPAGRYAVANAYRIPVLDASADLVLKIFAPAGGPEIARVLAPGGIAIEAIPRPGHMAELRRLIYRTDREHDDSFSVAAPGVLRIRDSVTVTATLDLTGPQLHDLLQMTPYWHHADEGVRDRVAAADRMVLTLDCELRVLTADRRS